MSADKLSLSHPSNVVLSHFGFGVRLVRVPSTDEGGKRGDDAGEASLTLGSILIGLVPGGSATT